MSDDDQLSIPRRLRARVRAVAGQHNLGPADAAARHFIVRGLDRHGAPPGALGERLRWAVEAQGYASEEELIEHLVLRALRAYEEPVHSAEELAARLRGLGYID
jgi:hypothetical protein